MRAYADSPFILRLVTGEADSPQTIAEYRRLGSPKLFFVALHALEVRNAILQRAFRKRRSISSRERQHVAREGDAALARLEHLVARRALLDVTLDMDVAIIRASARPTCPASGSSPVVGLVESVIQFALTNQVADGVCSGFEQMPPRAHQLAGQFAAARQRLDADDSLASLRPLQPRARMNVKLARNVWRDADLIVLGNGRRHGRNLQQRRVCNKPAKPRWRCVMAVTWN